MQLDTKKVYNKSILFINNIEYEEREREYEKPLV